MCNLKKIIISFDITTFESGTLASLLVELVDAFNGREDFWLFFRHKARCVVIHAVIGKN